MKIKFKMAGNDSASILIAYIRILIIFTWVAFVFFIHLDFVHFFFSSCYLKNLLKLTRLLLIFFLFACFYLKVYFENIYILEQDDYTINYEMKKMKHLKEKSEAQKVLVVIHLFSHSTFLFVCVSIFLHFIYAWSFRFSLWKGVLLLSYVKSIYICFYCYCCCRCCWIFVLKLSKIQFNSVHRSSNDWIDLRRFLHLDRFPHPNSLHRGCV